MLFFILIPLAYISKSALAWMFAITVLYVHANLSSEMGERYYPDQPDDF